MSTEHHVPRLRSRKARWSRDVRQAEAVFVAVEVDDELDDDAELDELVDDELVDFDPFEPEPPDEDVLDGELDVDEPRESLR
jgi:hypothetical protein